MKDTTSNFKFLSGGGEMGELMRAKDWSKTSLGDPATWPQSLRTILGILLNSKFPKFLWWGPELICFYNDAYRPSLGINGKHPSILGMKAEDAWVEIWPIIKPLIDQVLSGGGATWSEDQLIPIYRNGSIEDVYWTFSYCPAHNEEGEIAGVLVTCTETTDKVLSLGALAESKNQLQFALDAAELATFDYDPLTKKYSANDRFIEWFGLPKDTELNFDLAISTLRVDDRERAVSGLKNALKFDSGGNYNDEYTIVHPLTKRERIVKVKGKTWFNNAKIAYRFNGTLQDITEYHRNTQKIKLSEDNLKRMILQAPIAIAILRGREYIVEIANKNALAIWGRTEEQVLNKSIFSTMPELLGQGIKEIIDEVYDTGVRFSTNELPVQLIKNGVLETVYINFSYEALYDSSGEINGIMPIGIDVTQQVLARQKVEANEEKLNIIIKASDLGIWEYNLNTNVVDCSDRTLEILGFSNQKDVPHQQLLSNFHPDDLPIRKKAFEQSYTTGVLHYEARIIWEDKTIHWMEALGKVFFDQDNKPERLMGTMREITKERFVQQQLQEREQKFRLLADSMPQFVWTSDPIGNLNYFNESVFNYSGLTPSQLEKNGWLQMVHPDDQEENIELWKNSIASGEDFLFEHRFRRHDGTYRWQLSRATPQRDEQGNIRMWVGTSTDIQDQKEFTNELERMVVNRTSQLKQKNKELVKMNAELQSFAYVSSHDLQEPLRKVQTFASRLLDIEHDLSPTGKDYLERMQMAARRMQMLIQDLLAYSRTNTSERKFEKTDLTNLINEVRRDLSEEILQKDARIEIGQMPTINVISFQINQLFNNLISNSLKFINPGTIPQIRISSNIAKGSELSKSLSAKKKYCHITFSDEGIGFDSRYSNRIFEVFQQLNGKGAFPGTGIGLAIVKRIVDNHNGMILATGQVGKGATFNIYLPISQPKNFKTLHTDDEKSTNS